jgi:outer membrane protein
MMKTWIKSTLAISLMAASVGVAAYESGDMIVRAGAISVNPSASSDVVAPGVLDVTVDVGNNTQLGLTGTYMFSNNVGVEVVAATPFSHDINVNEITLKAGDTKHLPPTIMLQYYPMASTSAFQPYVGLGLNHTVFFESYTSDELDGVLAGVLGASSVQGGLDLSNSTGLAVQIGFDYALSDNLGVNMAAWKMDIDTTATVFADGSKVTSFDVAIDPMVYMAGIYYKF